MKIALAQLDFLVGDIYGNANRIVEETKKIHDEKAADLVVFPELALCGYPPEDLLFRPGFYTRCERAIAYIQENITDTPVIIGYPERIQNKIYNKAAFIHQGKIVASYAKQELPNYTVFDEKRYFAPGKDYCVFTYQNISFGLIICEDIWFPTAVAQAKKAGAEIIICINASPFNKNQERFREHMIKERIAENELPVIYCNMIGGQDELVFDGGSMVFNAQRKRCLQGPYYQEKMLITTIEKKENHVVIKEEPLPPRLSFNEKIYKTLKLGVADYIRKNHFPSAIIGLSGGIDSALTLAIAADAIGPDKITALIMPSPYTAQMSMDDAIAEAEALKITYHIIPITDIFNCFLKGLSPLFKNKPVDTTEENLQARIRGMILMAFSNKFGGIVLTTGNKSEMSVGYATLYGDMAGGLAVIKDVPKMLVYELARYRNQISPVIPERVITRAPTAELKPHQLDQDSLPPYPILDEILERYIEKDEEPTQIIQSGFDSAVVDRVVDMINKNEYKRRQSPIGIRLSQRAFGKDRRYPITSGYTRSTHLREKK